MKHFLISSLSVLFLLKCSDPQTKGPEEIKQTETVQLNLFAAPPCHPCDHELKELNRILKSEPSAFTSRLNVRVYVETGDSWSHIPSIEASDRWKERLGVDFEMVSDLPGGRGEWTEYRKYFPQGKAIPTAVVLNSKGEVLKKFGPVPTYTAEELVDFIKENLD